MSWNSAGSWQYQNQGLTGQLVQEIVRSGQNLFAACRGAIFRMGPGQDHFDYASQGLPIENSENTVYSALAAHPQHEGELIAGSGLLYRDGIFRTTDAGASWNVIGAGTPNFYTVDNDVAYDPVSPQIFYVATNAGMLRTTNGGASFSSINSGLGNLTDMVMAVDPVHPAQLYLGTGGAGIYRSSNRGDQWVQSNAGIQDPAPEIQDLAVDARNPSVLYATNLQTLPTSLYKSTSAGVSWFQVVNDLPSAASRVGVDLLDSNQLYVVAQDYHIYQSSNGGGNWTILQGDLYYTRTWQDPLDSSALWAATLGSGAARLDLPVSAVAFGPAGDRLRGGIVPNPFTTCTRISWNLPGDRDASGGTRRSVWAGIYDARGRLVRRLLLPGSPTWDGTDGEGHKMPSGRYFVRLKWEGGAETGSVVLVR